MLPVLDGFALLQQLRRRKRVPVIMLTARVQQQDRIQGLDAGADDYLPKPFDPDELLARIRAVLRRTESRVDIPSSALTIGSVRLEPVAREVWSNGKLVELTSTEFDLLDYAHALRRPRGLARRDYRGPL